MRNKIILLFLLAFIFQGNSMFAQGCDTDEPTNDSIPAPKIKVFGFMQPEYSYNFTDPTTNSFAFRRARLGVRGRVEEDFSYYFMLEASSFIGGVGSAYLMDAFITWDKYNWARVSVGSFKQPFGLEVTTACSRLVTVDRAIVSDQLVAPQRDYGVMLLGGNKFTKLNYSVALMNGTGLNVKDNNNKKDIIGRVTYKLLDFMTVGGSVRYGYPNNDTDTRSTYGGEVLLNFNNLHVQGEYIYDEGDYNRAAGGGCGSEPMILGEAREGAYGMVWLDTKWDLQPVLKYEYFDQDVNIKDLGYSERMTFGVNYFFNDKIRLQLNYQANIENYVNVDNDKFLAQLQVVF